jgi:hypothetical protein
MNDMNQPYPVPPVTPAVEPFPEKHSPLGIASFVVSILAMLTLCGNLVIVYSLSGGLIVNPSFQSIDAVLSCLAALLALVALGLGIAAVTQKKAKKVFGILGIVFSSLFLLGYCGIVVFNVINLAGSM